MPLCLFYFSFHLLFNHFYRHTRVIEGPQAQQHSGDTNLEATNSLFLSLGTYVTCMHCAFTRVYLVCKPVCLFTALVLSPFSVSGLWSLGFGIWHLASGNWLLGVLAFAFSLSASPLSLSLHKIFFLGKCFLPPICTFSNCREVS